MWEKIRVFIVDLVKEGIKLVYICIAWFIFIYIISVDYFVNVSQKEFEVFFMDEKNRSSEKLVFCLR